MSAADDLAMSRALEAARKEIAADRPQLRGGLLPTCCPWCLYELAGDPGSYATCPRCGRANGHMRIGGRRG